MAITHVLPARIVTAGQMVFDQADLFEGDGSRSTGVEVDDLQLIVHLDSNVLPWTLESGEDVPDTKIAAGKVYWTEFSPGYYSLRFFPNAVGFWRVILVHPDSGQELSYTYDAKPYVGGSSGSGLKISFFKE